MSTTVLSTGSNDSCVNEALQSLVCPKCDVKYANIHELLTHQRSSQHFACNQCNMCFWTEDGLLNHKRESHRPDLDLECFGCQSHFDRATFFWQHLEDNKCPAVFPSDIARLREKNLGFAEQLELRRPTLDDIIQHEETHIGGEYTWAPKCEEESAPEELGVISDTTPRSAPVLTRNAHPLYYHSEDFPVLPTAKEPAPTPSARPDNRRVWPNPKVAATQKLGNPNAYNAVPPPSSYDSPPIYASKNFVQKSAVSSKIQTMQVPVNPAENWPPCVTPSEQIIDPDHPDYNPVVFHNTILERYVCPYKICRKKFPTAFALTKHLRSPTHTAGRIACICCRKSFANVASLIGHMETTTKCPIRRSDGFRRVLGQITGGILDFRIRSGMFIIDQKSVQELLNLRSDSTALSKTKGVGDLDVAGVSKKLQHREANAIDNPW
ncbi:hypothetical protein F5Y14DRAFT_448294 [Nemania sp. NC0429]|nr:hypothetical protein F5Y14DRAFT_448294 [Nemania sp. NC0429]